MRRNARDAGDTRDARALTLTILTNELAMEKLACSSTRGIGESHTVIIEILGIGATEDHFRSSPSSSLYSYALRVVTDRVGEVQ
jgi:hypothetical protein